MDEDSEMETVPQKASSEPPNPYQKTATSIGFVYLSGIFIYCIRLAKSSSQKSPDEAPDLLFYIDIGEIIICLLVASSLIIGAKINCKSLVLPYLIYMPIRTAYILTITILLVRYVELSEFSVDLNTIEALIVNPIAIVLNIVFYYLVLRYYRTIKTEKSQEMESQGLDSENDFSDTSTFRDAITT